MQESYLPSNVHEALQLHAYQGRMHAAALATCLGLPIVTLFPGLVLHTEQATSSSYCFHLLTGATQGQHPLILLYSLLGARHPPPICLDSAPTTSCHAYCTQMSSGDNSWRPPPPWQCCPSSMAQLWPTSCPLPPTYLSHSHQKNKSTGHSQCCAHHCHLQTAASSIIHCSRPSSRRRGHTWRASTVHTV